MLNSYIEGKTFYLVYTHVLGLVFKCLYHLDSKHWLEQQVPFPLRISHCLWESAQSNLDPASPLNQQKYEHRLMAACPVQRTQVLQQLI